MNSQREKARKLLEFGSSNTKFSTPKNKNWEITVKFKSLKNSKCFKNSRFSI